MIYMAKMNIVLDDALEERFRKAVFETKGMKKGNISSAIEEALDAWIKEQEKNKKSGMSKK